MLDSRDMTLLLLAGQYRWLPCDALGSQDMAELSEAVQALVEVGLITISRSKQYMMLSPRAYQLLEAHSHPFEQGAKRAFSGSTALRRRLEVSHIGLTCLRAGILLQHGDSLSLRAQPVFLPTIGWRAGASMMSNANCAGFGHFGGKAYMFQPVSEYSCGMVKDNELSHFYGLRSVFDRSHKIDSAMILAGPSYQQVYKQIHDATPSKRHGKRGFLDFWAVYKRADIPIHLLACDALGAMQLAVMKEPDYNARIARAAFGDAWQADDPDIPDADGCVDGQPLAVAVDMDIRRVLRVCAAARSLGRKEVMVAAFQEQFEALLGSVLAPLNGVTLLAVEQDVVREAFGASFALYTPERQPYVGPKGGGIYV